MPEPQGRTIRRVVPEHREELLGLPYPVTIRNAVVEKVDAATGEVLGRAVPDLDGLVAAVAMLRALAPVQLGPEELRFLRKAVGKTAKAFSEDIGIDPSTYSRWENGSQAPGEYVERLVRHYVCENLAEHAPAIDFDPKLITTMKVVPNSSKEARLDIEVTRLLYKDGATREKSQQWDAAGRAA
jgi:transcriptional regulator with XRE-family HTH domain